MGIVFICGALMGGPADAQLIAKSLDITAIRQIPSYNNEMKEKDFIAGSKQVEEKPTGDQFLSFQMRIPNGWTRIGERMDDADAENKSAIDIKLSRRLMGKIVKYYGVQAFASPSRIEINAVALDHKITARNWFIGYVLSNSYTLQGLKEIGDDHVEALYVMIEDAVSYVVRTEAIINGPRMVLVSYFVPEANWPKERAMQGYALNSFTFLNPEKTQIEPSRTYAFLDLLRFDYPAAWHLLAPNISSTEGMDVKMINAKPNKELVGQISMRVISTELETSLPQEINFLKEDIQGMGMEVGDLVETPARYKFHPQVTFSRVEVYNAKPRDARIEDHEYWLAVMAEDRYYYIVSMITPARNSDFYAWAANTEAFRLVIESIRP